MGKPPSINIFIREEEDEVVQLDLSLLTSAGSWSVQMSEKSGRARK